METFRQIPGSILATVMFFVLGETGFVRKRSGFAAAWVVGILVVGAVLFGTPDRAEAVCDPGWTGIPCNPTLPGTCIGPCQVYFDCSTGQCLWHSEESRNECYCLY